MTAPRLEQPCAPSCTCINCGHRREAKRLRRLNFDLMAEVNALREEREQLARDLATARGALRVVRDDLRASGSPDSLVRCALALAEESGGPDPRGGPLW